jgi:hypothetical protein
MAPSGGSGRLAISGVIPPILFLCGNYVAATDFRWENPIACVRLRCRFLKWPYELGVPRDLGRKTFCPVVKSIFVKEPSRMQGEGKWDIDISTKRCTDLTFRDDWQRNAANG